MTRQRSQYFDAEPTPLRERIRSFWMALDDARPGIAWALVVGTLLAAMAVPR